METAEANRCRKAILDLCATGQTKRAQAVLGQFVLSVAKARGVSLSPETLTIEHIFRLDNLTPDRLEGLWQWLWNLLPDLPDAMRRKLVGSLEPVAMSPALPLHLYLDVFCATTLREKPEATADLFARIACAKTFAEGHALFQRTLMTVEQRMVGEKAWAFASVHDCYDALLAKAWAEGAPSPLAPRDAEPRTSGEIERCAIVTDAVSDARGHGPTRMVLNYTVLLRAAGATVQVFEAADRYLAADQGRFNRYPVRSGPFDAAFLPHVRTWRPSLDKPRLDVLRDTVEAIGAFAPDVIIKIGAPRSFAASEKQWSVPVHAVATSSYWPGEMGARTTLIKGVARVRAGFDGLDGLAKRLVEHHHFMPKPRLSPAESPIMEPFLRAGVPEGKRILGTVGWNAAHAIDHAFAAMMRRVLDAHPDFVWCVVTRTMPPAAMSLRAAGRPVYHVPPIERLNRALAGLYALVVPDALTGGAGGLMRSVTHGCPVVARATPLSDGVRLFLADTAFDSAEAYHQGLLALMADRYARDDLLAHQRIRLNEARADATIDEPEKLARTGRDFLELLAKAGAAKQASMA